jgi:hypothetical protein
LSSKSITQCDIDRATITAGYQLTDKDEIAVQQKLQVDNFAFGQLQIGYQRRFSDNLEMKLKVDNAGVWSWFARCRVTPGFSLGFSLQSTCGTALSGINGQPFNFGLRITHNS